MLKVMLAVAYKKEVPLPYPLIATPKFDGIRCSIQKGVAVSRTLKPIPNRSIQKRLGTLELEWLDGELIVGRPTAPDVYTRSMSGVMSQDGEPDVTFYVFDWIDASKKLGFQKRFDIMNSLLFPKVVHIVRGTVVNNDDELAKYEETALTEGYEGIILRSPNGLYKQGRSTLNEAYLIKVKRFSDSEAVVIGYEEQLQNNNAQEIDERGYAKRSSVQANMAPKGTLGALLVRDLKTGVEFSVGTGFDNAMRDSIWSHKESVVGQLIKYKYFEVGNYEKPRFPVFLGFRSKEDM